MYSIVKKGKPSELRKSQNFLNQRHSQQCQQKQTTKHNISRDAEMLTRKWNSTSKTSHGFRTLPQSHHHHMNRHSQIRLSNQSTHFERTTLHRTYKQQQNSLFYFYIKNQGNNSERVSEILTARGNWLSSSSNNHSNPICFCWGALNKLNSNDKNPTLFSRISGSYQLTDKARLYQNIVNYCAKKQSTFPFTQISNQKFLPVTFCFTSRQLKSQIQESVQEFLDYFHYIQSHTSLTNSWIMKPTNLNRGRDIFLFNSLEKMLNLLYVGKTPNSDYQTSTINKFRTFKSNHKFQIQKNDKQSYKLIQEIQQKINFNRQNREYMRRMSSVKKAIPIQQTYSENQIRTTKNSIHKPSNALQLGKKPAPHLFRARENSLKLKTQGITKYQDNELKKLQKTNHRKQQSQKIESQVSTIEFADSSKSEIELKLCQTIINFIQGKSNYGQKSLKRQIVIQKYIQNPFLIKGNKFDIRIWVLVDQYFNFYIFKSGYLRFSSQKYKLDEKSMENNFIHLTNHAVQKYSDKYEKNSNIVKMSYLKEYLEQNCPKNIDKSPQEKYEEIEQQMQRIIAISLEASLGHFYRQEHNRQKYESSQQFELFGYDFLLDRELKVRLIEANCNPSITEDNFYLEKAVPRMLNDMFKLTVDKVYMPKQSPKQMLPMDGFGLENMWRRVGKIGQVDIKSIKHSFQ